MLRALFCEKKGEEKRTVENIVNIIANFGFPIALSCYLLIRLEAKLERLTESINALATNIARDTGTGDTE